MPPAGSLLLNGFGVRVPLRWFFRLCVSTQWFVYLLDNSPSLVKRRYQPFHCTALYCMHCIDPLLYLQKYPIVDVRGRGLMMAAEFGGADGSLAARPHTAADVTHAAGLRGLLLLGAGEHFACAAGACCA